MGAVTKEMEKHNTNIRRDRVGINRDQAIVERLNRTLAERLFGHQYAFKIRLLEGLLPRGPSVVSALNGEVTRLTGKKPAEATKGKAVYSKTCDFLPQTCRSERKTTPLCGSWSHLYKPDELEGERKVYIIEKPITKPNELILYYLHNGHKRDFVREELLVVPANTELPLHL